MWVLWTLFIYLWLYMVIVFVKTYIVYKEYKLIGILDKYIKNGDIINYKDTLYELNFKAEFVNDSEEWLFNNLPLLYLVINNCFWGMEVIQYKFSINNYSIIIYNRHLPVYMFIIILITIVLIYF